jgi:hypothetical protein
VGKREEPGGFWLNNCRLPAPPPLDPEQRRGGERLWTAGRRRLAADRAMATARRWGNEEGVESYLSIPSPRSRTARLDGSSASSGGRQWCLGRWCLEAREAGRFGCGGARRGGERGGLFIGVERRFGGRYFELAELQQWQFGKVRCGLRPAGFAVNQAL